ncbi:AEC family transporter [Paenibacillus piri]|uniref:AEC family transporter n=1 Tax=Paenibacillus piri TaxID=2547395 RepID=UPI001404F35E|nr:AEC family transporter [Paenibacillus piri]
MTPIAILIGIGMMLQKIFKLEVKTLTKIILYLFLPAALLEMTYKSRISLETFFIVLLFLTIFYAVMLLIIEIYIRIRRLGKGMKGAVRNSVILDNNGNYGIPLNQLVFMNEPFALSIQIIVLMVQTVLLNTFGIYNVMGNLNLKQTLKTILMFPSIYCLAVALILNYLGVGIPSILAIPLNYLSDGFLAVALVTLGVQMGSMKWKLGNMDAIVTISLKLIIAPMVGLCIIFLLNIHGIAGQALILTCTVPTSLTGVLLAVEFDSESDFASQAAFSSTIASVVTVSLWIYVMQFL